LKDTATLTVIKSSSSSSTLDWLTAFNEKMMPDFDTMLKNLTSIGAAIERNNHKYKIKITGPTGIAHIFCDQPHGAQLKKGRLAGWFLNMKAGLERAGYLS
jgi:hypothetical protein